MNKEVAKPITYPNPKVINRSGEANYICYAYQIELNTLTEYTNQLTETLISFTNFTGFLEFQDT